MIAPDLFAYVGEDEFGSGEVGLKQGLVPSGSIVPLVAVHREKMERPMVMLQMQQQAMEYRKTIRLIRYVATEVVLEIEP